jgi:hypothetical protein
MKKIIFTTALICATVITGFAQVGIGTTTPNTSSILDLTSTSKALLLPRLTSTQRDAITPTVGMVIFNTTTDCMEFYKTAGWYNVCTGTTTGGGLPPIDGFSSSNQVAASKLLAHWTFDGTTNETISNTAPFGTTQGANAGVSSGTTSFVTGRIGQALQFTNAFLTFPIVPSFGNDNSAGHFGNNDTLANGFTISMWAQVPASNATLTSLFQLSALSGEPFWAEAGVSYRTNGTKMDLDGGVTNIDGTGTHSSQAGLFLQPAFNDSLTWAFITMTYDTTGGGKLVYYGNGAFAGSVAFSTLTAGAGDVVFPIKEALLMETPNYATIGTFTSTTAFPGSGAGALPGFANAGFTGTLDDIRLFNTTLTAQQVSDLYQLGNQGR